MERCDSFDALMARLRAGDDSAETFVFRRFVGRLVALAGHRFEAGMRDRADAEGVVQSVYRSFFARQARGEFDLDDWNALWGLLAVITLRKCETRREYLRAAIRDVGREALPDRDWEPIDREPTPSEAATLAETVEGLLSDLELHEREIACRLLQGWTAQEIAQQMGCSERTVRRLRSRLKNRLRWHQGEGEDGS